MFRNYIITALRSFSKSLTHVSTNVIGLGIGIGLCIMTFLLSAFNSEFNKYYDKSITNDIYRLEYSNVENDEKKYYAALELAYTNFLDQDIPGIESVYRYYAFQAMVKSENDRFQEFMSFCNEPFLHVFSKELIAGSYAEFNEPDAVYISEDIAEKYFGDESAIGKPMDISVKDTEGGIHCFIVRGVFKNGEDNASFGYVTMLSNFDNLYRAHNANKLSDKTGINATTFIEVTNSETISNPALIAKLDEIALRMNEDGNIEFRWVPFSEIHKEAYNEVRNTMAANEIPANIILTFNIMSILILLIACFNYTIYAFSFAGKRLKEIGVRKVSGGNRKQIIMQFLLESMVLSIISLLVGIMFSQLIIPTFDRIFNGFPYQLTDVKPLRLGMYLVGITLIMALVSGFYPAFYVSRFNPSAILAKNAKLKKTGWVTYSLVLFQQLITIVGLGATFIFTDNIHWQENMDYGYDKENLLTIQGLNATDKSDLFIDLVKQHPKVISTGISWKMLGFGTGDRKVTVNGTDYYLDLLETGPYYLETNKVRLVQGRFWDNESESDMIANALVNKEFLKTTNITDPFNEKITLPNGQVVNVIGVIENYKQQGPWDEVEPTVIHYPMEREFKFLAIRGKSLKDLQEVDEYCKQHWESLEPVMPYLSFFESFEVVGARNLNLSYKKTFLLTAIIALLLSIGGMFSLITMLLQKRTKEIAIRKSLGSNIQELLYMFSKPYFIVSLIAGLLGSFVGFYAVTAMLNDMYDYHVKVKVIWYILATFTMLLVTLLTISTQTIRAARANPVKGLRYE